MSTPKIKFEPDGEWHKYLLGEICAVKTGPFGSALHADDYVKDGTPIVTTEHFKNGVLPTSKQDIPQVNGKDLSRLSPYILKPGDIVFSRVGSIDINAIVTNEQTGWLFSSRVLRVRPNSEINGSYLHYELSTERVKKSIADRAVGQTMPSINTEILKETPVYVPSDLEQQEIATLFTSLDAVISDCQSEVGAWEKYKRGIMQQLFSQKVRFKADDGSEYPKWEKSNLGSHCEFYNGDRGKNYPKPNDLKREGIPFINAGDLVDGKIALNTANKITKEKYNSMSGAKIKDHDIVYCLRGSIGKNAIVDHLNDGTVASSLVVIRAKDINFKYLFYFLNSDLERKQRVLNDEGCAQPNLSAKNVSNFIIHVPCIEEQQKIADCLSAFDEVIDKAKQKLEAYKQLKKGLLQQMFV